MIWLILAGFAFVLFLDAYRSGLLDKVKLEIKEWLKKPLFSKEKKQDK